MEGFEVSRQQAWLKRMRGTVGNCSRGPREARTGFLRIGIRPPLCLSRLPRTLPWLPRRSARRRRCSVTCPIKAAAAPFPKRKWYKTLKSCHGAVQDHKQAPDCRGSRTSSKAPKQAHVCEWDPLNTQNQTPQKTEVQTSSFCGV
jgi:hypothetical protein